MLKEISFVRDSPQDATLQQGCEMLVSFKNESFENPTTHEEDLNRGALLQRAPKRSRCCTDENLKKIGEQNKTLKELATNSDSATADEFSSDETIDTDLLEKLHTLTERISTLENIIRAQCGLLNQLEETRATIEAD